jgi:hypothetical protein
MKRSCDPAIHPCCTIPARIRHTTEHAEVIGAAFLLTEFICVPAARPSTNKWDKKARKLIFAKTLLVLVPGGQSLSNPCILILHKEGS